MTALGQDWTPGHAAVGSGLTRPRMPWLPARPLPCSAKGEGLSGWGNKWPPAPHSGCFLRDDGKADRNRCSSSCPGQCLLWHCLSLPSFWRGIGDLSFPAREATQRDRAIASRAQGPACSRVGHRSVGCSPRRAGPEAPDRPRDGLITSPHVCAFSVLTPGWPRRLTMPAPHPPPWGPTGPKGTHLPYPGWSPQPPSSRHAGGRRH